MYKPNFKLSAKKSSHDLESQVKHKLPKLIQIGNSVGLVISKILLKSINWKKGDFVEYEYDGGKKRLTVRNLTAEQRDFDAIHGEDRTNF